MSSSSKLMSFYDGKSHWLSPTHPSALPTTSLTLLSSINLSAPYMQETVLVPSRGSHYSSNSSSTVSKMQTSYIDTIYGS